MDDLKKQAYRIILSAGLLHIKWDLACWYGGRSWRDRKLQNEAAQRAAFRAFAFHNLAIGASADFAGFNESRFWADIEKFRSDKPNAICPYRDVFESVLRGERVNIIAPGNAGSV